MARVWFEARNTKEALALAKQIWQLRGFDDCCIMIETPKKAIAFYGGEGKADLSKGWSEIKRRWNNLGSDSRLLHEEALEREVVKE